MLLSTFLLILFHEYFFGHLICDNNTDNCSTFIIRFLVVIFKIKLNDLMCTFVNTLLGLGHSFTGLTS